ncbi:medium-chain fatty acid-CoA ligase faa2, partial [Linderina macrospora]
ACLEAGVVAVPVYVDETPENTAAIVAHSKAQVLITSTEIALKLGGLLTSSSLTHAVVLGELDGSDEAEAVRSAVAVVSFEELQQGEGVDKDVKIAPTDPAYVLYETDESAKLRGVVVSHANALSAVSGILANLPADKGLTSKDSFMSAMPMAEPTNLSFVNTALLSGCSICVCETTDAELFATQAYPFAPTFTYMNTTITSDLFQLFFSHIEKYPNFEATLFKRGYKSVVDTLMRGMRPKRNFTDFAYLRHYRNVIGGKLRLLYLSADVPSKHVEWFRVLHGAHVIPVFGTAQTAGVATAGHFYDYASAIENHN